MSTDSTEPDVKRVVREELNDQLDVGDLVGDGSIVDQIDGARFGRAVGSAVGASLGRQLGRRLARTLTLKFLSRVGSDESDDDESDDDEGDESDTSDAPTSRWQRVWSAVKTAFLNAVQTSGFQEALRNTLTGGVSTSETSEEGASASNTTEEDTAASEPDSDNSTPINLDDVEELSPESLEGIKKETYREFLEGASYKDLQSIAKDVGVKANLSRDDMISQLVDNYSEQETSDES